jgi:urease accessory protein
LPAGCCLTGDRILAADLGALALDAAFNPSAGPAAALSFSVDENGRTHVAKQFAPYPFHICRPFYMSGDPAGLATVYVQSCAGGIFEHDRLGLTIQSDHGSQAHVTTSASTIVHGMPFGDAKQSVNLIAESHSLIEYLPDPMILFAGARIHTSLNVVIDDTARVILSDAFLMHDHRNQDEAFDWFRSDIVVRDTHDQVLVRDRIRVDGKSILNCAPGVTGRYSAQASFMFLGRGIVAQVLQPIRVALDATEGIYAGVSLLPGGLGVFARILASDGVALRAAQAGLWMQARKYLTGTVPNPRRK